MISSSSQRKSALHRLYAITQAAIAAVTFASPTALADAQSITIQQTLGACSPAIMNVTGNVTLNCITITYDDFVTFLKRYSEQGFEQRNQIKSKLAAPEEAYLRFVEASRAYLAVVSAATSRDQKIVDEVLIKEALAGINNGPQRLAIELAQYEQGRTPTMRPAPDLAEHNVALGDLMESQGNLAGARTAYEYAIKVQPTSGLLHRRYASLLLETGKGQKAIDMLEEFVDRASSTSSSADLVWAYDGLAVIQQSVGQLDVAEERFRFARATGQRAVAEGKLSAVDFASVLNDAAGAEIRKRKFARAEGDLCAAVQAFSSNLGPNHRTTLNAALNLATLWREMGFWNAAERQLQRLENYIARTDPVDPLRGYSLLGQAQIAAYRGDPDGATGPLDRAFAFFAPRHSQLQAHAQRLGRVQHIRGLIAGWKGDIDAASIYLKDADRLFSEAYGQASFDGMQIAFWDAAFAIADRREAIASSLVVKMSEVKRQLRTDRDQNWQLYETVLLRALEYSQTGLEAAKISAEESIAQLFRNERRSDGYDVLADGAIFVLWSIHKRTHSSTPPLWSFIKDYRASNGARLGGEPDEKSRVFCH
jgi:hypothetical protein